LLLYSGPIAIIVLLAVPYLLISGEEQHEQLLQEYVIFMHLRVLIVTYIPDYDDNCKSKYIAHYIFV
jgi:hypothetical protein